MMTAMIVHIRLHLLQQHRLPCEFWSALKCPGPCGNRNGEPRLLERAGTCSPRGRVLLGLNTMSRAEDETGWQGPRQMSEKPSGHWVGQGSCRKSSDPRSNAPGGRLCVRPVPKYSIRQPSPKPPECEGVTFKSTLNR